MRFRLATFVALVGVVCAAPDAFARNGHHSHSSSGGRGFGSSHHARAPRALTFAGFSEPTCASAPRRIVFDDGLRRHRRRRCDF